MDKLYKVYLSQSFDPKFNLSVEEYLMKCNAPNEVALFLWQNQNTIVIGRNQNPYKECAIKKLREDDVQLVRRLSGGGAVYHDEGNLNFTFITTDEHYSVEQNMKVILNGISKFGIYGHFNGRNDLMVQDRKFSGNAFIRDGSMNCHHGTLLIDVDLDKLSKYLTVSPLKLQSKGIDSVISRVINLKQLSPQITIENLKDALITSFNEFYEAESQIINLNENTVNLACYLEKYDSWEWNYSESPDFSIVIEERFSWGIFEIHLESSNGKIQKCKIFTDSVILEDFQNLENLLQGKLLQGQSILDGIKHCIKNQEIQQDLYNLIKINLG